MGLGIRIPDKPLIRSSRKFGAALGMRFRDATKEDIRRFFGCTSKNRYEEYAEARAHMFNLWRRNPESEPKPRPYMCTFCGGWHVGRPIKGDHSWVSSRLFAEIKEGIGDWWELNEYYREYGYRRK